ALARGTETLPAVRGARSRPPGPRARRAARCVRSAAAARPAPAPARGRDRAGDPAHGAPDAQRRAGRGPHRAAGRWPAGRGRDGGRAADAGRARGCAVRRRVPGTARRGARMMRPLVRRELAIVLGARVTWLVAAISALLVGHGFVLALDLYTS